MPRMSKKRREALELAEKILQVNGDDDRMRTLSRLRRLVQLASMKSILDKVPGDTLTAKAKVIGISRQAYYQWLNGIARPNEHQATIISKLTGIPVDQIREPGE